MVAVFAGAWFGMLLEASASLVGYWKLDESSGTISDSAGPPFTNSSNSLDPSNYSKPTVTAGTYGSITLSAAEAAAFNTSIFIPFNNSFFMGSPVGSDLNLTGNFTVMGWVNPLTLEAGSHMGFATGAGGEDGWKFGAVGNQLRFTANGVADLTVPTANYTIQADQFFHYAVRVTGASGTRTVDFFANGNLVYSTTVSNIKTSTALNMLLGNNGQENPATPGGSSFNENWIGLMDELKIFNAPLTQSQIQFAAVGGQIVLEPSVVALLSLGRLVLWRRKRDLLLTNQVIPEIHRQTHAHRGTGEISGRPQPVVDRLTPLWCFK